MKIEIANIYIESDSEPSRTLFVEFNDKTLFKWDIHYSDAQTLANALRYAAAQIEVYTYERSTNGTR